MLILGLNAYHGDVSSVLVQDGRLIAAVEEERFRRVKHCAGFPAESIRCCLKMAGAGPSDIDYFAVSRNPKANLGRKVLFALKNRPGPGLVADRLKNSGVVINLPNRIASELGLHIDSVRKRMHWVEHHPAHLASAFFVSPFDEAAVCAIDAFGDSVSTSGAIGRDNKLIAIRKVFFPHSIGTLYVALTQYLGFLNYGDEYKVMGLAAYGKADLANAIRKLIHLEPDGGFRLDLSYFKHWSGNVTMTWNDGEPILARIYTEKLEELLGPARGPDEPLNPHHEAVAASLQAVFEEVSFHVLNALYDRTKLDRLCLAGGCAMNSVLNGKVRSHTPFRDVYIQPAAGDNGSALGAAYYVWNHTLGGSRNFVMEHGYWGPEYSHADVEAALDENRAEIGADCTKRVLPDQEELCAWTAAEIADGKIVGWYQGRMEWGSRALGNRSILADPRRSDMRDVINSKIKFRERFRPFAPSILEEYLDDYFTGAVADPFMIQVYNIRHEKRPTIPAVTHADGTGRLQTVSKTSNMLFWKLIKAFHLISGVPVLLNTSFNENEPIVLKPQEAISCFLRTQMDVLVLGNYVLEKRPAKETALISPAARRS